MTVDLLKQIMEISNEGLCLAENKQEFRYYSELKTTADEAIKLIAREPITA